MYSGQQKRKPLFSIAVVLVFDSAGATLIAVGLALFLGLPVQPTSPKRRVKSTRKPTGHYLAAKNHPTASASIPAW